MDLATYLMVAIIHKQMKLPGKLHRTLGDSDYNQLNLFDS
jgi:hypothetical protein